MNSGLNWLYRCNHHPFTILSASAVVIHYEEALYQVYAPLLYELSEIQL